MNISDLKNLLRKAEQKRDEAEQDIEAIERTIGFLRRGKKKKERRIYTTKQVRVLVQEIEGDIPFSVEHIDAMQRKRRLQLEKKLVWNTLKRMCLQGEIKVYDDSGNQLMYIRNVEPPTVRIG